MGRKKECDDTCICSICCGKHGNRVECTCSCNKCDLAVRRLKQRLSGDTPKHKPPASTFKLVLSATTFTESSNASNTSSSTAHSLNSTKNTPLRVQKHTQKPRNKHAKPSNKGIEEMMHYFCYNEQLAKTATIEKIVHDINNEPVDSFEDLKALNFGTFSENVASRLYKVRENMWVMPCYTPETAFLHKTHMAVVQSFPEENKISCSCPQAKLLLVGEHEELMCWHMLYLRYSDKIPPQMEVCALRNESESEHIEAEDDLMDEAELTRVTRSGVAFSQETARTFTMPLTQVDSIYKIPGQLQWLVVDSTSNFCWVYFSKVQQRFKCRSQHPNSPAHRCHANAVAQWAAKNMEGEWKPNRANTTKAVEEEDKLPFSHLPIPLVIPNHIRAQLQAEKYETSPIEYRPELELLPEHCKCGENWKNYDEAFKVGRYFTIGFVKDVQLYCRRCVNNTCTRHYDGQSNGVLNYSVETLISYTMLHEFFNCCVRNSMSWAGFLNKTNHMYNDIYSMQEEKMQSMSSHTFSKAALAYLKLTSESMDMSYCPCCGQYPEKLIFDGTDIGIAFRHVLDTYHTWITHNSPETDQEVIPLGERCFLKADKTRKKLDQFCKDKPTNLSAAKWKTVIRKISIESKPLADLLQYLCDLFASDKSKEIKKSTYLLWLPLLKACASFNSICPLIPFRHIKVAVDLFEGGQLDTTIPKHAQFLKDCPLLCNIINGFGGIWPVEHIALFGNIINKCALPFLVTPSEVQWLHGVTVAEVNENEDKQPNVEANGGKDDRPKMNKSTAHSNLKFWQQGEWYPHWPKRRACKKYPNYFTAVPEAANSDVRWQKYFENVRKHNASDGSCRKFEQGNGPNCFQVPGIFIICCEHGYVYGFHMMIDPEGRKDLFHILYERYPQHALNKLTVIYDFACNALEYCLNKEPLMFKHTKFLVDRFHYLGHKYSKLFSMDHYPHLRDINSAIMESINAFVQGFKPQLSQMTQKNFMQYLQYLFMSKNQDTLAKIQKSAY